MADAFVGKWKGGPENITGLKEYLDAIGKPEQLAEVNGNFSTVITKIDAGHFMSEVKVDGSDQPVVENYVIGGKSKQVLPGFGMLELDTVLEGDKVVSTANVDGVSVKTVLYVKDNYLTGEVTAGDATVILRFPRAL